MADATLTGSGGRDGLNLNVDDDAAPETFLIEASSSDAVKLPEGFNFGDAKFEPSGPDLVLTSPDGNQVVIQDYYEQDPAPDLHTPAGGELAGSTAVRLAQVNAPTQGQFAQAAPSADAQPIGQVESVSGTGSTDEDSSVVIDVLANDTDVDLSDDLSITDVSLPEGVDGTVEIVLVDGVQQVKFTPGPSYNAMADGDPDQQVVINYTISDGTETAQSTATVTISGTNDGPVANVDTGSTDEDSSVILDVLANDTDVDITDDLTITDVSLPEGVDGTVEIVPVDGVQQVKFTPGPSYNAMADGDPDQQVVINYTISDGTETAQSTATVTISLKNLKMIMRHIFTNPWNMPRKK